MRGGPSSEWPQEDKFHSEFGRARFPLRLATDEALNKHRRDVDLRLKALGEASLSDEEIFAARLFTGPMGIKYNAVLRGLPRTVPKHYARFVELCMGNCYEATLHCLNKAIVKLARLSSSQKLYRALPSCRLPREVLLNDDACMRGAIDYGVQQCTADEAAAFAHARLCEPSMLYEIDQGLVDRAADLTWLSMYPHEQMFAFPPLTALEPLRRPNGTIAKYTHGATVVLPMRAAVPRADRLTAAGRDRVPPKLSSGGEDGATVAGIKKLVDEVKTVVQRGADRVKAEAFAAELTRSIRVVDVEPPEVPPAIETMYPQGAQLIDGHCRFMERNDWGEMEARDVVMPTVLGGVDWHPSLVPAADAAAAAAGAGAGAYAGAYAAEAGAAAGGAAAGDAGAGAATARDAQGVADRGDGDSEGRVRLKPLPWTFFVPCPTWDAVLGEWKEGETANTMREVGQAILSQRELARKCFDGSMTCEVILTHRGEMVDIDEAVASPTQTAPVIRDCAVIEYGVRPGKARSGLLTAEAMDASRVLRVEAVDGVGAFHFACPRWDPAAKRWVRGMQGAGAYPVEQVLEFVRERLGIDKQRIDRKLGGGGGGRSARSLTLLHRPPNHVPTVVLAIRPPQGQNRKAALHDFQVVPAESVLRFGDDPADELMKTW